jgi:hypothetical protein
MGDRAFLVDLAAVAAVGVAICAASDAAVFMTAWVAAVIALRFLVWSRLPLEERGVSMRAEAIFFALCLVVGASNDWNSVVRHRIYDYDVASLGGEAGIPLWMLLYWGMILRFVATLCRWRRLDVIAPERRAANSFIVVSVELLLVFATRQLLYRYFLDPVLSWLPFAAALLFYVALLGSTPHERKLAALAAAFGPLVEIAFIRLGGLHHYHLGWLAGVPLWIVLWWVLAVLVWNDLSGRLLSLLDSGAIAVRREGPAPPRSRPIVRRRRGASAVKEYLVNVKRVLETR